MSIRLMSKVWDIPGLSATETLVMLCLADFANDGGTSCYPSMATIGRRARCSERHAKRIVSDLEERGLIQGTRTLGRVNHYVLLAASWPQEEDQGQDVPGAQMSPVTSDASEDGGPGTSETGTGDMGVPRSTKNHQGTTTTSSSPAPRSTRRGTRVPEPFVPTPEMVAWARENTPLVGAQATAEFVDYWVAQPGQRGVKVDWVATWRNWMRKAQQIAERERERRRPAGAGPARPVPASTATTLKNEVTPEALAAHAAWLAGGGEDA